MPRGFDTPKAGREANPALTVTLKTDRIHFVPSFFSCAQILYGGMITRADVSEANGYHASSTRRDQPPGPSGGFCL